MCFNSVGLMVSGTLFSPDLQVHCGAIQNDSVLIGEDLLLSGSGNVFSCLTAAVGRWRNSSPCIEVCIVKGTPHGNRCDFSPDSTK